MNIDLSVFRNISERASRLSAGLYAAAAFLIPLIIGSIMMSLSWQKWADILVDFGREVYVPWRISDGSVLYRDIAFPFGPLSPYWNALLFNVFGTHILTLALSGIIAAVLLAVIIYRIFIALTDQMTATAAVTIFLGMFAFSQYVSLANYNYVCPYSYNLVHGLILSFIALYLFLLYTEKRRSILLFVIGVVTGLVFLTKAEVFFALFIAMSLGIVLAAPPGALTLRKAARTAGILCPGFLAPILFFVWYLSCHMPVGKAVASVLFPYTLICTTPVAASVFYRNIMGMDEPLRNLLKLLSVGGWYAAVIADLGLIAYGLRRMSRANWIVYGSVIVSGLLFFSVVVSAAVTQWAEIFRPLPLAMAIFGACLFVSWSRARDDGRKRGRLAVLLAMTAFSLSLLLKMVLNARIYHYGFVLAMPATLLLVVILLHFLPLLLGREGRARFVIRLLSLALLGAVLITHMGVSRAAYRLKTCPVGFGSDALYDFGPSISKEGIFIRLTLDRIGAIIGANENFAVFPEGAMLNYWSRRINPAPHINFVPADIAMFGGDAMLNAFIASRPDYIVMVDKNIADYGRDLPGERCWDAMRGWIAGNYAPVWKIGETPFSGKGFGVVISKRVS